MKEAGYTPGRTHKGNVERMRANLEGIRLSQQRADRILAGPKPSDFDPTPAADASSAVPYYDRLS